MIRRTATPSSTTCSCGRIRLATAPVHRVRSSPPPRASPSPLEADSPAGLPSHGVTDGDQHVTAVDEAKFRQVLGHYPTGVVVVTATGPDGRPAGLAIGSFTSVSLDPPLVAFFPGKSSSSWSRIESAGTFCVNILGEDQEDICRVFASKG